MKNFYLYISTSVRPPSHPSPYTTRRGRYVVVVVVVVDVFINCVVSGEGS